MRAARMTIKDLMNSKVAHLNQHLFAAPAKKKKGESRVGGRLVVKHFPKKSDALNWMDVVLINYCQRNGLQLYEEYRFCEDRGWRFDWCIPALKVAIEFEGGIFQENSGHKTAKHYTKDTEKYTRAALEGWRVLRFTTLNYKTLIDQLKTLK